MDKQMLVEFLNSKHPVYNIDGNVYSYRYSEIKRYRFDNFDHKLVMIEFTLPSCFDQIIELERVAEKLTEKIKETVGKELFLISSERNVINRILIYVDFQDNKDAENKKNIKVQEECRKRNKDVAMIKTKDVDNNKNPNEGLKNILRDTEIFNKVRDFLGYYVRNCDVHHRDLNGNSYLSKKIELSNCGLKMDTEQLMSLYVEFCEEEGGFSRSEIDKDLDYLEKTIIARRICDYNQAITNGSHEERFANAKNWLMEYVSAKSEKLKSENFL